MLQTMITINHHTVLSSIDNMVICVIDASSDCPLPGLRVEPDNSFDPSTLPPPMQVVSVEDHNALIEAAYLKRGYTQVYAE